MDVVTMLRRATLMAVVVTAGTGATKLNAEAAVTAGVAGVSVGDVAMAITGVEMR